MRKTVWLLATACVLLLAQVAFAGEKAPECVSETTNEVLTKFSTDPVIVKAVKAENAKGKTLEDIKAKDQKWQDTAGIDDQMKSLMDSECGKHLKDIQKKHPYIAELFVMDNQGANVAMSNKTSDYWQGDEAKFKESYKGGAGAIHTGDVKFDDSSQRYLVQVSVPVKDGGKVIGAITFGLDVDDLEKAHKAEGSHK